MLKISLKHSLFAAVAVLTVACVAPVIATAQSARDQEVESEANTSQQSTKQNAEVLRQKHEAAVIASQEKHEAAKGRLEAAKLKACQNREKSIKNIMARMADRSTKQLDVFTKISERTQAFYVKKGNVLEGYDALVAAVAEKKLAAETAVGSVQNISGTFSCDGESPRGVATSFKESVHTRNAALKEYKTAVKNLIVGVKSIQGTTKESTGEAKS